MSKRKDNVILLPKPKKASRTNGYSDSKQLEDFVASIEKIRSPAEVTLHLDSSGSVVSVVTDHFKYTESLQEILLRASDSWPVIAYDVIRDSDDSDDEEFDPIQVDLTNLEESRVKIELPLKDEPDK